MTKLRTTLLSLTIAAAPVAGLLATISPAAAQPRRGNTPATCTVENADGTTSQVPEGTRYGMFFCGTDGEWHFGWLVDAITVSPTTTLKVNAAKATVGLAR